jgi:hypothetical protein
LLVEWQVVDLLAFAAYVAFDRWVFADRKLFENAYAEMFSDTSR